MKYNSLIINTLNIIFFTLLCVSPLFSQSLKENTYNKYINVKKNLKSKEFKVSGKINFNTNHRLLENENSFDYRLNANINIKYKGIEIPLSYSLSNGRTITRYNLPSYKTPSFKNLGISPTYKWAKIHIGHRQMSFTKYTYENLRFKGVGIELKPKGFHLLAFKGELFLTSNRDLYFNQNIAGSYKRNAWGTMFGYSTDKDEFSGVIFKADDDISQLLSKDSTQLSSPKANTAIAIRVKKTIYKKIEFKAEKALSALTQNLLDNRVDIKTHATVYNMLGLYTKRPSSQYREATNASLGYHSEKYTFAFNYEDIARQYRSLGSLFFDNGYTSNTISFNSMLSEKLNLSTEIGLRSDRLINNQAGKSSRLITNSQVSYKFSETISSNVMFSNFKNTQLQYYQNLNNLSIDSLQLSLVNSNLQIGTNYFLDKEKKQLLNFLFSTQSSNSIEKDTLSTINKSKNNLYSVTYSKSSDKQSFQANINYITNKSNFATLKMLNTNITHSYNLTDKSSLNNGLQLSFQTIIKQRKNTFVVSNGYDLNLNKKSTLRATSRTTFSNQGAKNKYGFIEWFLDLSMNYAF